MFRSASGGTCAPGAKGWAEQVAARRIAVHARLPGRSWAGIISYMYRTSPEVVDTVRVFGPRLNSKYIDKKTSGERVRMQKTWNKCIPRPRLL